MPPHLVATLYPPPIPLHIIKYYFTPSHTPPYHSIPFYTTPHNSMLLHITLYHPILLHTTPNHLILLHTTPYHPMHHPMTPPYHPSAHHTPHTLTRHYRGDRSLLPWARACREPSDHQHTVGNSLTAGMAARSQPDSASHRTPPGAAES